jgi:enoyl-CoA hydratase/carnithine racemase
MTEHIVVTDDAGVRTIRLNRADKKNALTLAMYAAMTELLQDANKQGAIRCVMFAGAPGVFCAGNDLADFLKAAQGGGLDPRANEFIQLLAHNEKPLVAAVNGPAVGLGTTMLLHCDYVVAGPAATLSTPFIRLGLIPEAASTLLAPLRMGHARAFSLLVMGRPLSAADAKEAGIVNTVVDDPAAVEGVALKAAQEIAALPPRTVAVTRRLMRSHTEDILKQMDAESAHYRELLQSEEARAAFQAFFARKK